VEAVVAEYRPNQFQSLFRELSCQASALHRTLVVFFNRGQPPIEGGLISIFEQHRNASIGEYHGDPTPHSSDAHHCHNTHWYGPGFLRYVWDLGYLALAEEHVDKGLGLIREQALSNKPLLDLAAFFERQSGGSLNRVNGGKSRDHATLRLLNARTRSSEDS